MTYFDLLKKMRGCNWQSLAEDLGVTPQTLKSWRDLASKGQSPGKSALQRCHQLFHLTVGQYEAEWITIAFLNFDNIRTIGGRR